jgi:hypothetical protein
MVDDKDPKGQSPKTDPKNPEFEPSRTQEEEFFGGKFKNVDELVKGYQEVEKAKTRAEQERAELQKTLQDVTPLLRGQGTVQQNPEDKLYEDYATDPIKATRGIISDTLKRELNPMFGQMATVVAQVRLDAARNDRTMPEFSEWEEEIKNELNALPEIYVRPEALKIGYRLVKEKRLAKEREKEQAGVEGKGKITKGVSSIEDLKGMSSDDIIKKYASTIPMVEK